jgi:nucleotide-binding universal stress UspA family protein
MTDSQKIVVPTDFSGASWKALDWVRQYAQNQSVEIHCIFVMQQTMTYYPVMATPLPTYLPTISQLRSLAETNLTEAVDNHKKQSDPLWVTKVLVGRPADEIVAYADDIEADMIVIAARGRNAVVNVVLGDTAAGVVRQSSRPVVTVKAPPDEWHVSETLREEFAEIREDLGRSRDALRDEIELTKDDLHEDWEELEDKWQHFNEHLKDAGHEAADAKEDIGAALSLLGQELKKGYQRIRDTL